MAHRLRRGILIICLASACVSWTSAKGKEVVTGFPVGIPCSDAMKQATYDERISSRKLESNDTVQCVIKRNDEVKFNKTISWGNRSLEGIFFDATEDWNNVTVNVSLIWSDEIFSAFLMQTTKLFSRDIRHPRLRPGEEKKEYCTVPGGIKGISRKQFSAISTTWYKDGVQIGRNDTNFKYAKGKYRNWFNTLTFLNPSCESSPGTYECKLEYKGSIKLTTIRKVCTRDSFESVTPAIRPQRIKYEVEPGSDLAVACVGYMGRLENQIPVIWSNNQAGREHNLCGSIGVRKKNGRCNGICTCSINIALDHCELCTQENKYTKNSSFIATFTIRNISYSDAGKYQCKLNKQSATFDVIVKKKTAKMTAHRLIVGISSTAGFALLLFLTLVICRWKRVEVKYLRKKIFESSRETAHPVTYLVYSCDAVDQSRSQCPLSDVKNWLIAHRKYFYDPHDEKSFNDIGEMTAEHSKLILRRCLSMTVFVTENLLNENSWDLFRPYMGFKQNIEQAFPIVFICEREMEQLIKTRAKLERVISGADDEESRNTFVTFLHFMKRNTVIYWKPDRRRKLHRALYAALPKVRRYKDTALTEPAAVCEV